MGVNVIIMNHDLCKLFDASVTEKIICAGPINVERNACQGDYGGPLACGNGTEARLVGVAFNANNCNEQVAYYTRIANYRKWIKQISGV